MNSEKTKAGLWIDHREAVIVLVSPEGQVTKRIQSHADKLPERSSGVRSTQHAGAQEVAADDRQQSSFTGHLNTYYDEVIACLQGVESVLIFGPGEAKGELKKRLEKSKQNAPVAGIETSDKMTHPQIEAKVREYFKGPDRKTPGTR